MALATDPNAPTGIAVDGIFVYWTDADSVMKVANTGGPATILASGQSTPWAVVAAGDYVYWTDRGTPESAFTDGSVVRVPIDGSVAPTVLASAQVDPRSLATDGTNVYWSSGQDLMSVSINGGNPATLVTQQSPINGIAVNAMNLYWTSGAGPGSVMTMRKMAPWQPIVFASASALLSAIAASASSVCWISEVDKKTSSNCMNTGDTGGMPTQLMGWDVPGFTSIAVDESHVYLTALESPGGSASSGTVSSVPQVPPPNIGTTLATGQTFPPESNVGIAVDETSVYWIADNTVQRLSPK